MIVDSTALTEQVVRDVLASAFQSAGQRCSALRVLYVQEEARARVLEMLSGAMETLVIGDPWEIATDVGPVIDAEAQEGIEGYIAANAKKVLKTLKVPGRGRFVPPTILAVDGIGAVEREVFGPVLHLATFRATQLDRVVDAINGRGFGLTCGLHSRIDDRVERVTARLHMGNTYVNRNQIGAIVGSQPFGGEGLSGTGPKAGRAVLSRAAATSRRGGGAGSAGRRGDPRRDAGEGLRGARRRAMGRAERPGRGAARGARRGSSGTDVGGGPALGTDGPAGADRREQPAEPASAGPRALPRRGRGERALPRRCRRWRSAIRCWWSRPTPLPPCAPLLKRRPAADRARRPCRPGGADGPARSRAGRGARAGGLAARPSAGAGRARRADRAAGDRAGRAGALCRRAPPLHRHHRGRVATRACWRRARRRLSAGWACYPGAAEALPLPAVVGIGGNRLAIARTHAAGRATGGHRSRGTGRSAGTGGEQERAGAEDRWESHGFFLFGMPKELRSERLSHLRTEMISVITIRDTANAKLGRMSGQCARRVLHGFEKTGSLGAAGGGPVVRAGVSGHDCAGGDDGRDGIGCRGRLSFGERHNAVPDCAGHGIGRHVRVSDHRRDNRSADRQPQWGSRAHSRRGFRGCL